MSKSFDFSEDIEPIQISYNGDVFLVAAEVPADIIVELANVAKTESEAEKIDALKGFMMKVLLPEYREAYQARLNDQVRPIGFKALLKTFETLLEHYTSGLGETTARPTEAPSLSQPGLLMSGLNSTQPSPSGAEVIRDASHSTGY